MVVVVIPDGHVGTGNGRQLDGTRETLVTLGVVVLQTDLKLDGLEEVPLLLILRVVEQLLDVLAHSGCSRIISIHHHTYTPIVLSVGIKRQHTDCDLRHGADSLPKELEILMVWLCAEYRVKRSKEGRKSGRAPRWRAARKSVTPLCVWMNLARLGLALP